jgi:predicted esterase YcpF (UPF0227 family)
LCFFTEPGIIKRNLEEKDIDELDNKYTNEKLEIKNYRIVDNNNDDINNYKTNNNNSLEIKKNINTDDNINFKEDNLCNFMPSILRYLN